MKRLLSLLVLIAALWTCHTAQAASTPTVVSYTANGVEFRMILVVGGKFAMGATPEQGDDYDENELPVHDVKVRYFHIGETEVTQELWEAVMGNNPSTFKGPKRPVERVTWDQCKEFIARLNEITGEHFRLPYEAEWEWAARGGIKSKGYKWAGSNQMEEVVWCWNNCGKDILSRDPDYGTHNVATKAPNELGIYDMCGNVSEWCQDWFANYDPEYVRYPTGPQKGVYRIVRGGAWEGSVRACRITARTIANPLYFGREIGLRLAL